MYTAYFGLKDNPFSITPDPAYLYLSPHHQEALAHLLYGIGENGGFVLLTGEVGTGKTLLVRTLVDQHLEKVDIALCLNPRLTVEELVAAICDELQVHYPRTACTLKTLIDVLNAHLLKTHAQGHRTVLIIDEAQHLSREVLEQVRLLTNLETRRDKLLRVILAGQPELQQLMERPDLRQLAQRITARYHLLPLNRKETVAYILHRLQVAGGRAGLFTRSALRVAYCLTGGVPRLINIVCDRALLGAYSHGLQQVNASLLRQAAREVLQGASVSKTRLRPRLALELLALGGLAAVASQLYWPELVPALSARWSPAALSQPAPVSQALSRGQQSATAAESAKGSLAAVPTVSATDIKTLLFDNKTTDDPMVRLLAMWGIEFKIPAGQSPCEHVQLHQLRCLSGQADWEELRRYNHPALLQLKSPQGDTRQVLLRSLEDTTAILDLAGRPVQASLAQLQAWWSGDYLMLWRPPIPQAFIGPGSTGEPVVWLRQHLAIVEGQDSTRQPLSEVFDPALRERVRHFQRANALHADGVVGQRTMALLHNLVPAPGTPVLTAAAVTKVN
jgi:general secretion pathway protein A